MLKLISRKKERDSNSTLCNLNFKFFYNIEISFIIVIVHFVVKSYKYEEFDNNWQCISKEVKKKGKTKVFLDAM